MNEPSSSAVSGMDDPFLLYDFPGAASRLAISERHLKELWARRAIGAIKVGKLVRFREQDLLAYIDAHVVPPVR